MKRKFYNLGRHGQKDATRNASCSKTTQKYKKIGVASCNISNGGISCRNGNLLKIPNLRSLNSSYPRDMLDRTEQSGAIAAVRQERLLTRWLGKFSNLKPNFCCADVIMEEAIWQRPIRRVSEVHGSVSAFRSYANVWPSLKKSRRKNGGDERQARR